ncbi:nucleotidyl transferase AbiEii/AbiGii toxin family protein [Bacteroides sp. 51]|uniref:nucleotidyl transferase AbiEii/AbiGii toxin family protein n=1 Tax=Bacteroides sp. 51 TaxID=2302938 RepID=UPI00351B6DCD
MSEDIDLAVDPAKFGMKGDLTKKQIKKLRKSSSLFVKDEFYPELNKAIEECGLGDLCTIEVEPNGKENNTYPEPRKIWIKYESVLPTELDYLKTVVMLEIGARSLMEPYETTKVQSMVEKEFPTIETTLINSEINTAIAGKTFLEKAFLLHELFSIKGHGEKANRKSRHMYDLAIMMEKNFAKEAIKNDQLWETIRHHREIFTSVKDIDYSPDIRKRIVLVPGDDILTIWEKDYSDMQTSMIYGEKPKFSTIIERMKELEMLFRGTE